MPATPYLYERQGEYFTSRGIEDFYLNSGFEVRVLPITQLTEASVPSDFIFLDQHTTKLFGLQYKALYHNGRDYWNIDQRQHDLLQRFDWMYYGLSDMTSGTEQRNALHYLRIMSPEFSYEAEISRQRSHAIGYVRWGAHFKGLQDCKYGRRITTPQDLTDALWPYEGIAPRAEITRIAHEVLITDFESRHAVRYSSLIRPEEQ